MKSEIIEAHALNVTDGAKALGVSRQALSELLNGHTAISSDMALRLEKAFGVNIPDADLSPRRFETLSKIEQYIETHSN